MYSWGLGIGDVGMFFLGKKMRNERKKRANELTDDNYDYNAGIINS